MSYSDWLISQQEKDFVCRKCGWRGYTMVMIKTDEEGNELPIEEWKRGCPNCKTDKYIVLGEE